ncbi:MAG: MucR family transcriptional regulator [Rhodospirillales bacterium]|jgi:predicted transcriptional regulator|nr:MucR family transcriptional regulator [Rhodospirillales bacterium]
MAETPDTEILDLTAGIVAAHVSNNAVSVDQIPSLIKEVHKTLAGLGSQPEPEKAPAVSIKRSVKKDAISCLECGQPKKMLKRHLSTAHGLSVSEYRDKWKLASDYPMTAPNYAAQRSKLAKKIGLGTTPRKRGRKKR